VTSTQSRVANSNRMNNSIEQMVVNEIVLSDKSEIKEYIVQFYDILFTKWFSLRSRLYGVTAFGGLGAIRYLGW
jgi:hypothetical protein